MGAEYMDYIIADKILIPETHQHYYSEKIVYLPDTYQPNDLKRRAGDRTPTRSEVGLPEKEFVFCCFNHCYKITPETFAQCMRLLQHRENSVLWLLQDNATATRNLKSAAAACGVAPERLIFAARIDAASHLARLPLADLFLDTQPYGGHTTASDALWMGLPVVTSPGESFASRVASSLLNAIGLPELSAPSLAAYESLALKLAQDEAMLAALKAKLAANRLVYPLFGTEQYTRHLEAAYQTMSERYRRGEQPEHFAVRS
jgi:predicted O-linked N-acetylglucosamine transferase (SPINDLY family)